MPEPETRGLRSEDLEAGLALWQDRLKILVRDVKGWVEKAGWRTRTIEKPINDRKFGRHTVPVLLMERNAVEVALNPVSPHVPGAEGGVDLYLVPAYDDIASLYFERGQWVIHYYLPVASEATHSVTEVEPVPLSEESVNRVLDAIASHAA